MRGLKSTVNQLSLTGKKFIILYHGGKIPPVTWLLGNIEGKLVILKLLFNNVF